MAEVLELAQLLEDYRVAEVDIRGGGIETELDPEGTAAPQALLELVARDYVYRVGEDGVGLSH